MGVKKSTWNRGCWPVVACALTWGLWAGWPAGRAAEVGLATAPSTAPAAKLSGLTVLYPMDRTVLGTEVVMLMAVAPKDLKQAVLTLDGKPVELERIDFAGDSGGRGGRLFPATRPADTQPVHQAFMKEKGDKAMWAAKLTLSPGEHVILAGGTTTRVYYSTSITGPFPAGWAKFKAHGFDKSRSAGFACRQCHAAEQSPSGEALLGLARSPAACAVCHEETDLQATHRHVMDGLARCHHCHDPHGSMRPALLVDSREKLCVRCHEAGHSKR